MNRYESLNALHTIGSFRERINDPFPSLWTPTSHLGVLINDGGGNVTGIHSVPRGMHMGIWGAKMGEPLQSR
jgi:hypothetical protein